MLELFLSIMGLSSRSFLEFSGSFIFFTHFLSSRWSFVLFKRFMPNDLPEDCYLAQIHPCQEAISIGFQPWGSERDSGKWKCSSAVIFSAPISHRMCWRLWRTAAPTPDDWMPR
jgi:hypothetical protein